MVPRFSPTVNGHIWVSTTQRHTGIVTYRTYLCELDAMCNNHKKIKGCDLRIMQSVHLLHMHKCNLSPRPEPGPRSSYRIVIQTRLSRPSVICAPQRHSSLTHRYLKWPEQTFNLKWSQQMTDKAPMSLPLSTEHSHPSNPCSLAGWPLKQIKQVTQPVNATGVLVLVAINPWVTVGRLGMRMGCSSTVRLRIKVSCLTRTCKGRFGGEILVPRLWITGHSTPEPVARHPCLLRCYSHHRRNAYEAVKLLNEVVVALWERRWWWYFCIREIALLPRNSNNFFMDTLQLRLRIGCFSSSGIWSLKLHN